MRLGPFPEEDVVAVWRDISTTGGLARMLLREDGAIVPVSQQLGPVVLGIAAGIGRIVGKSQRHTDGREAMGRPENRERRRLNRDAALKAPWGRRPALCLSDQRVRQRPRHGIGRRTDDDFAGIGANVGNRAGAAAPARRYR
jgi:hypothetical protein